MSGHWKLELLNVKELTDVARIRIAELILAGHNAGQVGSEVLWVRPGDAGDYESFDSWAELYDMFEEREVQGPFGYCRGGITCPDYGGNNYISLFWGPGDSAAEMICEISPTEFDELRRQLYARRNNGEILT